MTFDNRKSERHLAKNPLYWTSGIACWLDDLLKDRELIEADRVFAMADAQGIDRGKLWRAYFWLLALDKVAAYQDDDGKWFWYRPDR